MDVRSLESIIEWAAFHAIPRVLDSALLEAAKYPNIQRNEHLTKLIFLARFMRKINELEEKTDRERERRLGNIFDALSALNERFRGQVKLKDILSAKRLCLLQRALCFLSQSSDDTHTESLLGHHEDDVYFVLYGEEIGLQRLFADVRSLSVREDAWRHTAETLTLSSLQDALTRLVLSVRDKAFATPFLQLLRSNNADDALMAQMREETSWSEGRRLSSGPYAIASASKTPPLNRSLFVSTPVSVSTHSAVSERTTDTQRARVYKGVTPMDEISGRFISATRVHTPPQSSEHRSHSQCSYGTHTQKVTSVLIRETVEQNFVVTTRTPSMQSTGMRTTLHCTRQGEKETVRDSRRDERNTERDNGKLSPPTKKQRLIDSRPRAEKISFSPDIHPCPPRSSSSSSVSSSSSFSGAKVKIEREDVPSAAQIGESDTDNGGDNDSEEESVNNNQSDEESEQEERGKTKERLGERTKKDERSRNYEFVPVAQQRQPGSNRKSRSHWTLEEEDALRLGVRKYGVGKWVKILKDPRFGHTLQNRTGENLKDKYRNLKNINQI